MCSGIVYYSSSHVYISNLATRALRTLVAGLRTTNVSFTLWGIQYTLWGRVTRMAYTGV